MSKDLFIAYNQEVDTQSRINVALSAALITYHQVAIGAVVSDEKTIREYIHTMTDALLDSHLAQGVCIKKLHGVSL